MAALHIVLRVFAATVALALPTSAVLAQAEPEASPSKVFAGTLHGLQHHIEEVALAAPMLPQHLSQAAAAFREAAGTGGIGRILLGALAALIVGALFEWAFRRATAGLRARPDRYNARSVADRMTTIGIDALIDLGAVVAFAIGMLVVLAVEKWPGTIREVGTTLLVALLATRLILAFLGLLLRPVAGPARSLAFFPLDTGRALFWYRSLGAMAAWFAFGWAIILGLGVLGLPRPNAQLIAYVLGIGLLVMAIATNLQQSEGSQEGRKAKRWMISLAFVAIWVCWAIGAKALLWLMLVAGFMPVTISATHRGVRHVMRPVDEADQTRSTIAAVLVEQGSRALIVVGGILVLLWAWQLDVGSLAQHDDAFARLLRGGLHALIILLVADLAWQLFKAVTDSTLAKAQATEGIDSDEARRRARVRTLLPIGRNIAAIVLLLMAGLMALAALGVEIGPLIASAGVVGVAVGFGAQTVVRDIISGMFYMLDDAFRVGEYIQSGSYKGTVESFSLRSVKLRHQRGPLFTIPFGVLGAVQNMSRDWVMVKDEIGLTYDSDIDKAKKLIKQIGLELAKDPDIGPSILQPLKMQGIEQFGQYSINIRMKMMCKPGEQFVVRRRANAMIKKAFDENGIKFAFPTVQLAGGAPDAETAGVAAAAQQVLKPAAE
ncbi:MAG: mechanosensitive ion channel family protein [Enhydrobacter sp.]|nr:mechanosensitive ion channel family protein [Enhydrobacter sp.]